VANYINPDIVARRTRAPALRLWYSEPRRMNMETTLAQSPLVALRRFAHSPQEPHRDPAGEASRAFTVNFIDRGGYEATAGNRWQPFSSEMVFLTWPGLVYRCRHREEFPTDVCLSVEYGEGFAAEALRPGRLVISLTNRLAYDRLRLFSENGGCFDALALETRAAEVLASVAEASETERPRLFRASQLAWYGRRIDDARSLLEARLAEPHSLASLGGSAGMSPYHFARIFRELTGCPPHRYLLRMRLQRARRLLQDGWSVTAACYEVGFANLSHFVRQFRRAYGRTPSRLL
jgi:AraC-like DNA-binding protein